MVNFEGRETSALLTATLPRVGAFLKAFSKVLPNWELQGTELNTSNLAKLNNIKNEIIVKTLESLGIKIPEKFVLKSAKQEINSEAYEFFLKAKFAFQRAKNSTDLELARSLFQKAYESQPSYLAAKVFYARISFQIRKYDEAISILEVSEEMGKKTNNNN